LLENPTDLGRTAADAGQGFEHDDSFIDRLGRMFSEVRFEGFPRRLQRALGAMKRHVFQRFYPAGLIPFQVRA
jgi:hypothetical protein